MDIGINTILDGRKICFIYFFVKRCKDAKMYDVQKGVIYEEKKWG